MFDCIQLVIVLFTFANMRNVDNTTSRSRSQQVRQCTFGELHVIELSGGESVLAEFSPSRLSIAVFVALSAGHFV